MDLKDTANAVPVEIESSLIEVESAASSSADRPISVRLPTEALKRCDVLVEQLGHLREFTLKRASRSAILRLALLCGLTVLEAESKRHR